MAGPGPSRPLRGRTPYSLQGRDIEELTDVRTPLTPSEEHLLLRQLCRSKGYADYLDSTGVRTGAHPIDAPAARLFFLPEQKGGAYQWSPSLAAQFGAAKEAARAKQGPGGPMSALARLYFVTVLLKQELPRLIPFDLKVPRMYKEGRGGGKELMGKPELLGLTCLLYDLSMRTERSEAEKIYKARTRKLEEPMPEGLGRIEYVVFRVELPLDAVLRPPYRVPPLEERESFALLLEYRFSKKHFSPEQIAQAARELESSDLAGAMGMASDRVLAQAPAVVRDHWGLAELHLVADVDISQLLAYVASQQSTLQLGRAGKLEEENPGEPPFLAAQDVPVARLRRIDRLVSAIRVSAQRGEDPDLRTPAGKCGTKVTRTYVTDTVRITPDPELHEGEPAEVTYTGEPWSVYRETVVRGRYLVHLPHDLYPSAVSPDNRGFPQAVWQGNELSLPRMSVLIGGAKSTAHRPRAERMGPLCSRLEGPKDATPLDDLGAGPTSSLPPLASQRISTPAKPKPRSRSPSPPPKEETPEEEEERLLAESAGSRLEQTIDDLDRIFSDEDDE